MERGLRAPRHWQKPAADKVPSVVRALRGMCDFFARAEVEGFVEDVAQADLLSLVVGAGSSIESGFPDWTTLIQRLLTKVATNDGLSPVAAQEFAAWTISREGLTGAAATAEAFLGPDFNGELHRALYSQQLTPPPGQSALAIAKIAQSMGADSCDVATTNYDLVLESASAVVTGRTPTSVVAAAYRNQYSVLHLHGVMRPRGGVSGDLILSERDYFMMQDDTAWQQEYFARRMAGTSCVFVGASLTDPNLLRYLYRVASDRSHYAIFVRQQDARLYDGTTPEVVELRERTSEARWRQAKIRPLHADYFSQSAQLLHEVLHRRQASRARRVYRPLPKRLTTWRNKMSRTVLTTSQTDFASVQDQLHDVMSDLVGAVHADLSDAGHRPRSEERLGLSLWIYDPERESLTNWASSDRVWRDPRTMEPLPIDWTSDFVSVQAFCAGSLVSRSTEQYVATRWNHVIGAPLYLESERLGRLPVGAVTIASTLPAPDSALERGIATLRRVSVPSVERVLTDLLDPVAVTSPA